MARLVHHVLRVHILLVVAAVLVLPSVARAATSVLVAQPMPGPGRTEVAGAYWQAHGLIAVAGGFVLPGDPTADLLFYDVGADEWSRGPDLPGRRDHAVLVALDGGLYLVGGFTSGLAGATDEVWSLDAPTAEWRAVAPMGTARGALGAVAVDGRLYAVGGVDAAGRDLASTEWYDPDEDRWRPGPVLSRTRQHVAVATRGKTVFAIGGRAPNLDTVERVRFRDGRPRGRWASASSLGFSRSGNGAATVDGVVCTAGGEESSGTIAPIECLRGGRWVHVGDMVVARHGLAVVAVGDALHTISGGPEPGFAFGRDHEVLVLD